MVESIEAQLASEARRELESNILPFWRRYGVDNEQGGFVAQLSNDLRRQNAPKGLVLNARILWTFSAAFSLTQNEQDWELARQAHDYLTRFFLDPLFGGYFWELDPSGRVVNDRKKVYGQAFCLYALAEYHRVFHEIAALQRAQELFFLLESHAHDAGNGGYWEVLLRDWRPSEDMRLGDQDRNEKKSMNSHLHLLEAFAHLFRVWPDRLLADRLRELIQLFPEKILNAEKTHFHHFFTETWTPRSDNYTFGHDIEGSWLLCEAAEALGDPALIIEMRDLAVRMARATQSEGLDADGGLLYEGRDGQIINDHKEWWPQAEAVIGFFNAWKISHDKSFLESAIRCWQFIRKHVVDSRHGEWFWRVSRQGTPDSDLPKISAWKCPYHNGRCCLELIQRTRPPSQTAPARL